MNDLRDKDLIGPAAQKLMQDDRSCLEKTQSPQQELEECLRTMENALYDAWKAARRRKPAFQQKESCVECDDYYRILERIKRLCDKHIDTGMPTRKEVLNRIQQLLHHVVPPADPDQQNKYRKRGEIEAVQWFPHLNIDGVVTSPVLEPSKGNPKGEYGQVYDGDTCVATCIPGDWIITWGNGKRTVQDNESFQKEYQRVQGT